VTSQSYVTCSVRGWTFLQGSGSLQYWQCSAIFKKYLQCVLAARILIVDFVLCTLAVKKKSGQVSLCRIGPFPCEIPKLGMYEAATHFAYIPQSREI
jgi:hypothetical protein